MIQLANDPSAGRTSHRPQPGDGKASTFEAARGRSGHAWPFLSRYAARPSQQDNQKHTSSGS